MNKSLFIFRRDLRLFDNLGLIKALETSDEVLCCFVFNPTQLEENPYRSENGVQFMINSLKDLNTELINKGSKLFTFNGQLLPVLDQLKREYDFTSLFINRDFSPFSTSRDDKLKTFCKDNQIGYNLEDDLLLNRPENCLKADGKPYTIFTPFYNNAKAKNEIKKPLNNEFTNYFAGKFDMECEISDIEFQENENIATKGGRKEGLELLEKFSHKIHKYSENRDFPEKNATSMLSAHNKFGTLSVREIYHFLKPFPNSEPFLRQLFWRDFFTNITFHFPTVLEGKAFQTKHQNLEWINDEKKFEMWCLGKTGFPIVDAAMIELNTTGYMHNRCRMIVSSFLTKDLHISWTWGEKYFAQKLTDYDPCVNNGSWQWASSTGCDAQPYFRIFNPWLQQKKFDKDCVYIRKWIPQLKFLDSKKIHNIEKKYLNLKGYPNPILIHSEEKNYALSMFKKEEDE